jgi:hypothetical protein
MFVVPKLGRDPQIFTREFMKDFTYADFVTVHCGTVKMSVANFVGASHCESDLIGSDVVRAEGAQPYGRHESAAHKLALRDGGRVNFHWLPPASLSTTKVSGRFIYGKVVVLRSHFSPAGPMPLS